MDKGHQIAYMATLFRSFGAKFFPVDKTCLQYLWKPRLSSSRQTFLSKLIQSLIFVYFNELLPCPLDPMAIMYPSSRINTHLPNQLFF
jgi:hypothetical protein